MRGPKFDGRAFPRARRASTQQIGSIACIRQMGDATQRVRDGWLPMRVIRPNAYRTTCKAGDGRRRSWADTSDVGFDDQGAENRLDRTSETRPSYASRAIIALAASSAPSPTVDFGSSLDRQVGTLPLEFASQCRARLHPREVLGTVDLEDVTGHT